MFINVRGNNFSASKSFWQGTHRTISPDETFAKIKPYFPKIGLTRLSNITHLERIGIPVTQGIRPNSYSLSTSAGKGITLEIALVSAAMEAMELYCAETTSLPYFEMPYVNLREKYPHIPLESLPLRRHAVFHVHKPELWCLGWDLFQEHEVAVPLHSAVFDYRLQCNNWSNLLSFETISTNGLASGNHILEAITSGLLELVERDAITCCTAAQVWVGYQKPKVMLETIESPTIRRLLEQFHDAGLVPFLFDCTIDTDIPVYEVLCFDPNDEPIWTSHGCGAHLDPEIAMIRALTEAAQTRAVAISGARDDCFQSHYTSFCLRNSKAEITKLESYPATIDARSWRSQATTSFEEDIALILAKLQGIACQQAIVVNLTPSEWDISIVRVLVPGLEGFYSPAHDYQPSYRVTKFVRTTQLNQSRLVQQPTATSNFHELRTHLPAGGS